MSEPMGLTIVNALRKYGDVEIDFLARAIGRRPSEIEKMIEVLKAEKVVVVTADRRIHCVDQNLT